MNYWGMFFMSGIVIMPLITIFLFRNEIDVQEKNPVAATTGHVK